MSGSRLRFRFVVPLIAALCLLASVGFAQEEASPAESQTDQPTIQPNWTPAQVAAAVEANKPAEKKKYALTGSVVNSATGEGIPRAIVEINNQLVAMTDSSGNFQFDGLAAGVYFLTSRKPGYFNSQETGRIQQTNVELGPDTHPATLKLVPEALIFGRVTDSDGLPVQRLTVQCERLVIAEGRRQWQTVEPGFTDEDGAFRVANLMPGTYVVAVGPSRFPSLGAMTKIGRQNAGYSVAYYPAPADSGSSAGIRVTAGQKIEANIQVEAAPFYSVSGNLVGPPSGGYVRLVPRGDTNSRMRGGVGIERESGAFKFQAEMAGDYILEAGTQFENKMWSASLPVHVTADITGLQVVLEPAVTIPVVTRVEKSSTEVAAVATTVTQLGNRPPVQVMLRPTEPHQSPAVAGFSKPNDPSSFAIDNVSPGTYSVEFQTNSELYVASARYGSTDLLRENLVVTHSATQDPIEVVLRDDIPRLKLVFSNSGQPVSGALLIVPEHGEPSLPMGQEFFRMVNATLNQLRPGSYTVLVFDSLDGLEYSNPDALDPYLSRGAHVELMPNQETSATVELIKRGDEQ